MQLSKCHTVLATQQHMTYESRYNAIVQARVVVWWCRVVSSAQWEETPTCVRSEAWIRLS